jgi:hypothetical protein
MATLLPCHACHGKGIGGGEPTIAIRAIGNSRESHLLMNFKSNTCTLQTPRFPARYIQYLCLRVSTLGYYPDKEAGAVFVTYSLATRVRTDHRWVGGVGVGGKQPGTREASLGKGARCSSTIMLTSSRPKGG